MTNNGSDVRTPTLEGQLMDVGPRPIANDWDDLFAIAVGGLVEFFGWPAFFHHPVSRAVLPISHPPFSHLRSSGSKVDVSTDKSFGFVGDLFVAEIRTFVPQTRARQFTGYRVVQVDRDCGRVRPFVINLGNRADKHPVERLPRRGPPRLPRP